MTEDEIETKELTFKELFSEKKEKNKEEILRLKKLQEDFNKLYMNKRR